MRPGCGLNRQPGFASPSRGQNCQQSSFCDDSLDIHQFGSATHKLGQLDRQIVGYRIE
jgi:hypothetical protein